MKLMIPTKKVLTEWDRFNPPLRQRDTHPVFVQCCLAAADMKDVATRAVTYSIGSGQYRGIEFKHRGC